MERERKILLSQIELLREEQEKLDAAELELCKRYIVLSDKKQWYKERERTVGCGESKRTFIEGRVYWMQSFKDEDTGEIIEIERSRPVKENDQWDNVAVLALI